MPATLIPGEQSSSARTPTMAKKSSSSSGRKARKDAKETKVVRIWTDAAELAESLAPIYKKSSPDFLSECLLECLQRKAAEAPEILKEQIRQLMEKNNK